MSVHITKDASIEALKAAIATKGSEYVYSEENHTCSYFEIKMLDEEYCDYEVTDVPSCLVGTAIHMTWPEMDLLLLNYNEDRIGQIWGLRPAYPSEGGGGQPPIVVDPDEKFTVTHGGVEFVIDGDALHVLDAAQLAQDQGRSWGQAWLEATGQEWVS